MSAPTPTPRSKYTNPFSGLKSNIISEVFHFTSYPSAFPRGYHAAGVVAADPLFLLLFRLFSLGVFADLGVFSFPSFFSLDLASVVVPPMFPMPPCCVVCSLGGAGLRPVDERWNSPGRPVMGFSSMYSPPKRAWVMKASAMDFSSDGSSFLEAAAGAVDFPVASGIGVSSLDSCCLVCFDCG